VGADIVGGDTVSWHGDDTPAANRAGASGPLLRRIGAFVLLERLGAGGMGVVYAAFDERLERKVAIKLVTATDDDHARQRLLLEAQAQARLSHPNVVTIYEVNTLPEGGLFIAMELVKGATLRAWQLDTARRWQDLVAIYAAAGHGLAAAHREGIVHRDFKPDNVLIGDDGRVRVADFGLAFAHDAAPPLADTAPPPPAPPPMPRAASEPASGSGPPSSGRKRPALTAAGVVVGTPGYMAPEQFAGGDIDARTDQFAFCAALYEALHGERPFADFAFAGLASPADAPAPRRREPDPAYPRWLWDVVMRGLASAPERRFASMDDLLVELTRNRQRRRRLAIAAVAATGAIAAAAITASALAGHAPPPCPLATDELTGVWDDDVRHRAEAGVLALHTPSAPVIWNSTSTAFDRYAQRWLGAQQAACEATHVRHVQSADLLDRRMECLGERKRSLAAAVEVVQRRPAQAADHAGDVVASLGDIDLCADTGVLLALAGGTPAEAGALSSVTRARVNDVRGRLARANAFLATGDDTAAEPIVREAAALTQGLGDAIKAEVRYAEARITLAHGDLPAAIRAHTDAVELAVAGHHDELPPDIWLNLAVDLGQRDQRPAEIATWLGQAEAWLQRLGHPNDPRAIRLEHAHAQLQVTSGELRPALATLSHALERGEARWGKDDPRLIGLLRDRAFVYARLGQTKPAVADGERTLAIELAAWGPAHPELAPTRLTLGLLYIEQLGDVPRGEHEIELALASYRDRLGPDALEVANCEQALSQAGQYRGDYAAALGHAERAEQIYAAKLGADHPRRGEALMGIGVLEFMRKDFAGSLAADEAAYPILAAALGTQHTTVGTLLSNTGETLLALGRAEAALADFTRARAVLEKALGPSHEDLALPLKGIGLAELRRGQPAAAIPPLERALGLRTQASAASDPQELAEIRWGLARALRLTGREPARARALAEAALAGYRGLGSESQGRAAEIARWLTAGGNAAP
jgi:tetratricopeptide (TPR) repeat protein